MGKGHHAWTEEDDVALLSAVKKLSDSYSSMPHDAFWAWVADVTKMGITGGSAKHRYFRLCGSTKISQPSPEISPDKNPPPRITRTQKNPRHKWNIEDDRALLGLVTQRFDANNDRVQVNKFWDEIASLLSFRVTFESPRKRFELLKADGVGKHPFLATSLPAAIDAEKRYFDRVNGHNHLAVLPRPDSPDPRPPSKGQLHFFRPDADDMSEDWKDAVLHRLTQLCEYNSEVIGLLIKLVDDKMN